MNFLKDRRVIALGGGALALAAGLVIAFLIFSGSHKDTAPPPAAQGGLVVVSGRDDDAKLDPKRPLRCFVNGQFVGELPLEVCAQRNGVATGALDVGLDSAGALAAGSGANSTLTPLPPPGAPQQQTVVENVAPDGPANQLIASATPDDTTQVCWRWNAGGWSKVPTAMSLNRCVDTLFSDKCPDGDDALIGKWGDANLKLTDGQVEIAMGGRDFRPLVDPWPGCQTASEG